MKTLVSWSSGKDSAWGGPMFNHPMSIAVGEIVDRGGFVFADVS